MTRRDVHVLFLGFGSSVVGVLLGRLIYAALARACA